MSNEAVEGLEAAIQAFDRNDATTGQYQKIREAARLQLSRQQSAQRDSSETAQSTGEGVDFEALKQDAIAGYIKHSEGNCDQCSYEAVSWVIDYLTSQKLIGGGWKP